MNNAFARTGVSRADLARLVHALPRDRVASAAQSLGFERRREPDPTISFDWIDPDELGLEETTSKVRQDELPKPDKPAQSSTVSLPLWRQETMHFKPEPSEADAGQESRGEFSEEDLGSDKRSLFATPKPTSLAPWARLWPHLRAALQSTTPGREPDVAAWVRALARGDQLSRIPCLPRRTWANRISLWIDRSSRLVPFWSDQTEVCRRLQALCHRHGLDVRLLDAQTVSWSRRVRGDLLAGVRPDANVPVLVLGDLGGFGTDDDRALWRRTGRRLVRDGVRLSALVPCSSGQNTPSMANLWKAMPWERGRQRRGGYAPAERKERAERLLKMVSPAALVQPGLLRAIRLLLPPTSADASTEADVWVHPDVRASSGTAWILRPEAAAKWRAKFVSEIEPALQTRVSQTIGTWHKDLPRELLRAESLVWHGLLAGQTTARQTPGDLNDALAFAQRLQRRLGKRGVGSDVAIHHYGRALLEGLSDKVIDASPLLRNLRDKLEGSPPTRSWAIRQIGANLEVFLAERGAEWPSHVRGAGSPVALFVAAGARVTLVQGANVVPLRLQNGLALTLTSDEPLELHTDRCTVKLTSWRFRDEPDWIAAGRDRYGLWADTKIAGVVQRFRWIPPGRFLMGSPENEQGRFDDEGPQHQVTWTEGRWIGDTPVTQALWKAVEGTNPSYFQSDKQSTDDRPVEQVSCDECDVFVKQIDLRLPSEAEWEYACRAGTTTATWKGDLQILGDNNAPLLDDIAWYGGNCGVEYDLDKGYDATNWSEKQHVFAKGGTRVVRTKEANPFGLYDMLGNVYEWCSDEFTTYTSDAATDPRPVSRDKPDKQQSLDRVLRGGSWSSNARNVRAAYRLADAPVFRRVIVGFRLARGPAPSQASSHASAHVADAKRIEGRSERGKAEPAALRRPEIASDADVAEGVAAAPDRDVDKDEGTLRRWWSRFRGTGRDAAPARDEQAPKRKK